MKKKFKKYLITSFGVGLMSITIGSVAASCAISNSPTNGSDPSGENNSDTSSQYDPGQPLTPEQMDAQLKLANDIQVQFDANNKLDYLVPENKTNIDDQISKYDEELSKGELADLISKYNELVNPPTGTEPTDSHKETNDLLATFYNKFKEKNLILTQKEITEYVELPPDGEITWEGEAGYYSVFYSSPKAIILLSQCISIASSNDENKFDISKLNSWNLVWASLLNTNTIFNKLKSVGSDDKSPAYQALEYYSNFFIPKNP